MKELVFRQFDINKAEKKIEFTLIHDLGKQETKIIRPDGLTAMDRLMIKKASETELNKYTPLEQYTGIRTKEGQMIFVGDTVKNKIAIGVVKLGNPDFLKGSVCSMFYWQMTEQLDFEMFCFEDDVFTEFNDVEVIGHIHQEKK